ncbi:TRAP transporter substrate-binding protein [Mesorhizobium sp.]|uniref:TRAP transporter substrate-binding protein n=1 Tax=Mesorhizobium sp. TaxID=1871066 RepID=UPI000FE60857|nr:TRAP transporter substrate-binding protein [Mesorhizobium sp.]RWI88928.1 MAG: TRAP transporter substrate-binding protein [Mesorhizobium sp.]
MNFIKSVRNAAAMLAMTASIGTADLGFAQEKVILKVGHDSSIDSPYQTAAVYFKKKVEQATEGRVSVQVFPNAQLGDESTLVDGLKVGAVDVAYTSIAPISESVPEVDIFNLPFLFRNIDDAIAVANGPVGENLKAKIEPAIGGKVVGWGSLGERDMWNSKRPIRDVADLKGLKMRIQQSATQQNTYSALGALPTPIPYTELYTSLQTGVVDGADNGPLDLLEDKFYQVTKYVTMTSHFIVITPALISDKALVKLSDADKTIVLTALQESATELTKDTEAKAQSAMAELKSKGLEITELSSKARQDFIDAVATVYRDNAGRVGGQAVIDSILNR